MKTYKAIVRWFDRLSGEGVVRLKDTGHSLPIYACNIKGSKSAFEHMACVSYDQGQEIEIVIDESSGLVRGLTPGRFDQERYDRIDWSSAAFRLDDDGNLASGLFK